MKTSVIEVHDLLTVLSVDEVEKRIGAVPGVESVTVNFAVANATVRYDETQLEASDIKSAVRQRGYEAAAPEPAGDVLQGKTVQSVTPESAPSEPPAAPASASGASKPPDASAAPDEKTGATASQKNSGA